LGGYISHRRVCCGVFWLVGADFFFLAINYFVKRLNGFLLKRFNNSTLQQINLPRSPE
jgi:hypothetical protein